MGISHAEVRDRVLAARREFVRVVEEQDRPGLSAAMDDLEEALRLARSAGVPVTTGPGPDVAPAHRGRA